MPVSTRAAALFSLCYLLCQRCEMAESQVRQNYHPECEAGVNKQINLELYAFYTYLSLVSYVHIKTHYFSSELLQSHHFDRDDVALKGFSKFFKKSSDEELEHAEKLMKFQNQRGGRILLQDIKKPEKDEWGNGLDGMKTALMLERHVNQSLLDLHKIAEKHDDPQMQDFLEGNYLQEQVEAIKELGDYVTNLKRLGTGHGEWHFDRELGED